MSSTICIKQTANICVPNGSTPKFVFLFDHCSNIPHVFENSITSLTYGLYSKFLLNINGKNVADFHLGTINVHFALQATRCMIALITKSIGGTSQLFSENQFCETASIASDPGFQNKELNLCNLCLQS
jgi:hypothetical protein